jgi:hypothetical protein
LSIADTGALAETADMGCVYWRGDEHNDWLQR